MSSEGEGSRGASGVTVRPLTMSDVPAVSAILSESPGAALWSQDGLYRLASEGFHAWVAEQTACMAGFLVGRVAGDEFEILNVAVARAFRRRGVGSTLLECALEFSCIAGSKSVYLEVRSSNVPAIGLYARHGFTKCGRRIRYYQNPMEDALVFSRHIVGVP
jgi:ribosomal-protein-alanine acetyltransferase